jgi:hypothetical protein
LPSLEIPSKLTCAGVYVRREAPLAKESLHPIAIGAAVEGIGLEWVLEVLGRLRFQIVWVIM